MKTLLKIKKRIVDAYEFFQNVTYFYFTKKLRFRKAVEMARKVV